MKIVICNSYVPFIYDDSRNIVDCLDVKLREAGHQVERVYLPHIDEPNLLIRQAIAFRWVNLVKTADKIICTRSPAHYITHPNKIVWFLDKNKVFNPDDTAILKEARAIYTISQVLADQILKFNDIKSEALCPPAISKEQNDDIDADWTRVIDRLLS